jgi:hypothetical protein
MSLPGAFNHHWLPLQHHIYLSLKKVLALMCLGEFFVATIKYLSDMHLFIGLLTKPNSCLKSEVGNNFLLHVFVYGLYCVGTTMAPVLKIGSQFSAKGSAARIIRLVMYMVMSRLGDFKKTGEEGGLEIKLCL